MTSHDQAVVLRDLLTKSQAILMDVDGTLYRQNRVRTAVLGLLCQRYALQPRRGWRVARILRAYRNAQETVRHAPDGSNTWSDQLALTARQVHADAAEVRALVSHWMEKQPLPLLRGAIFPHVPDFLDAATRRGIQLGVVSDYKAAEKIAAMGLSHYFQVVISAQEAGVRYLKPSPVGLQTALERLGISPDAAVYIGDRPDVDALAALRAGLRCLILGGPQARLEDPWLRVRNYRQLVHSLAA